MPQLMITPESEFDITWYDLSLSLLVKVYIHNVETSVFCGVMFSVTLLAALL